MAIIKCTECGQEVSTEAEVCPHCGKPNNPAVVGQLQKKNRSEQFVISIIILVLICVGLYYWLVLPSISSRNSIVSNVTNQQVPVNNTVQEKPVTIVKKVGESFVLWDMEYQVLSVANFSPVIEFRKTTGKYIGVKIKVTNQKKVESGVNTIYITDSKDRQYNSVVLGYQQLGVEDYGEKVQPGFSNIYGVIFEVAKDSTGLRLNYPSAQGPIVLSVSLGL